MLLVQFFSICGSLERCSGVLFFDRIVLFHEHNIIQPRRSSSLGFCRLTVLRESHILLFYSFVAPLDETFFNSMASPVAIRARRWYIDLRATLRSSETIFTTFVTPNFLLYPALRRVTAFLATPVAHWSLLLPFLPWLFHHHQMKIFDLPAQFMNLRFLRVLVELLRLSKDRSHRIIHHFNIFGISQTCLLLYAFIVLRSFEQQTGKTSDQV